MSDPTYVVTGGTGGIGSAVATTLAQRGAHVVLIGRDAGRADAAAERIRQRVPGANIDVMIADLSLLTEVRALAAEITQRYPRLKVLILNAGVARPRRELMAEGFEVDLATNHLAPYLLAKLLSEHLAGNAPARIVSAGSAAHARIKKIDLDRVESEFGQARTYATSKLLNLLAMTELDRRLGGSGVTVNTADPGLVHTGLGRETTGSLGLLLRLARPIQKSPERGAAPIIRLATDPELADTSGAYFTAKGPAAPSPTACDPALAHQVWTWTESLLARPTA